MPPIKVRARPAGHFHPLPNTQMEFVSRKTAALLPDVVTLIPAQLMERDWKECIKNELETQHGGPPEFDQLIKAFIQNNVADNAKLDLGSRVICECMKHGKGRLLSMILAYADITSLCVQGKRIDTDAWKTLVAAMPDRLAISTLRLSAVHLDASSCKLLLTVLGRMPDLNNLSLAKVKVNLGPFSNLRDCPALSRLETLDVVCVSKEEANVHPLLLNVLRACQLRELSIEDYGAFTTEQHKDVAKALDRQAVLNSLKLTIARCDTPERFECYMPFLCGMKRFVKLDLGGSCIGVSNFNKLLDALSKYEVVPEDTAQNEPRLTTLSLSGCGLGPEREYNNGASIDIVRVAEIGSLRLLDLSSNNLRVETTTSLLSRLAEVKSCLLSLNLSGNRTGPKNLIAMASLLTANSTLLRLSFRTSLMDEYTGYTVDVLAYLVDAMMRNRCLCRLDIPWNKVPPDQRSQIQGYLDRNRKATLRRAMRGGMGMVLNSRGLAFPDELLDYVYEQGMTSVEAVRLMSVNTTAWEWSQSVLPDWRLLK
jgi:hypothetical protein